MESKNTLFAYRKKRNPDGDDKFHVFNFGDADITNEEWKLDAEAQVMSETVGAGQGSVWWVLANE